jgi:hypothetical protein
MNKFKLLVIASSVITSSTAFAITSVQLPTQPKTGYNSVEACNSSVGPMAVQLLTAAKNIYKSNPKSAKVKQYLSAYNWFFSFNTSEPGIVSPPPHTKLYVDMKPGQSPDQGGCGIFQYPEYASPAVKQQIMENLNQQIAYFNNNQTINTAISPYYGLQCNIASKTCTLEVGGSASQLAKEP